MRYASQLQALCAHVVRVFCLRIFTLASFLATPAPLISHHLKEAPIFSDNLDDISLISVNSQAITFRRH